MSLQGKVYGVTGGASGIGLATAKILASRGATVCIADVDDKALAAAEEYFADQRDNHGGVKFSTKKVDVSKRADVDGWIQGIVDEFGRLDGAANIAGVMGRRKIGGTIAEQDDDEWDRIIAVNLTGMMYCVRAELKHIADHGSIVNMASIHGTRGFAETGAYDASKHGVVGLTRAAALEVGAREIRINAVAPGAIYTPLMKRNFEILGRPADAPFSEPSAIQRQGDAEEVAAVIVFLLSPDSSFVSGSVYEVAGGWP